MKKRNPITEGMVSKFIDNIFTNIKNNQRSRNIKALKTDPKLKKAEEKLPDGQNELPLSKQLEILNQKGTYAVGDIVRIKLKKKIRNMRRAGLDSPQQEVSVENIAFKILRRNGILDTLSNIKIDAHDFMVGLDEIDNEIYWN